MANPAFESVRQLVPGVARIGVDPNDSDDLRLQKSSLVLGSIMFILAGTLWGVLYFAFGEWTAGAIPFGYAVFSSLSLVVFHLTRRYRPFVFSQLLLILFLPFLLMIALDEASRKPSAARLADHRSDSRTVADGRRPALWDW